MYDYFLACQPNSGMMYNNCRIQSLCVTQHFSLYKQSMITKQPLCYHINIPILREFVPYSSIYNLAKIWAICFDPRFENKTLKLPAILKNQKPQTAGARDYTPHHKRRAPRRTINPISRRSIPHYTAHLWKPRD